MFPTSPPIGASWSSSTWKLKVSISSINRLGLIRVRVDLRGLCRLGEGDNCMVGVGIDGGTRRRKNFLLHTRTLPLCVLMK